MIVILITKYIVRLVTGRCILKYLGATLIEVTEKFLFFLEPFPHNLVRFHDDREC